MAEEEAQEITIDEALPPKAAKKKSSKAFIMILVVLGLAGAAGYYLYARNAAAHGQDQPAQKQEKVEIGPIISLDPFVINVSGNSSRFVKISVAVELKSEKSVEQTKKMTPVMRDIMLTVLGTKAPEVFMDVAGRAAMKKELFESINKLFTDGGLKAVYITDIVMQ